MYASNPQQKLKLASEMYSSEVTELGQPAPYLQAMEAMEGCLMIASERAKVKNSKSRRHELSAQRERS